MACLKPQVVRPGGATKRPRLSTSLASTVYGRLRWCQLAVCTYVSRVQQPCGRVITSYVRSSDVPPPRTDIPTHHLLWCVCSSHLVPGTTGHLCCHRNTQGRKRYQVRGYSLRLVWSPLLGLQSRFGDNWGQNTWNLSVLSPKRDWGSKKGVFSQLSSRTHKYQRKFKYEKPDR